MKKVVGFLMTALLLTACGSQTVDLSRLTPVPQDPYLLDDQVTLETEYADYLASERVYAVLDNASEHTAAYSIPHFEYCQDGTWYEIPWKQDTAFTMVQPMLPSGRRTAVGAHPESMDFPFPAGQYRLCIPYRWEDTEPSQGYDHAAYAEFTIAKKVKRTDYAHFVEQTLVPEEAYANGCAVFSGSRVLGQEIIDAFIDKALCGIPCEMRIISPEEDLVQHFKYDGVCYTVQDYVHRAVETHCYSWLYYDPELEELFFSNYADLNEASAMGYTEEEPEDYFQLGLISDEIVEQVQKAMEDRHAFQSTLLTVYLFDSTHSVSVIQDPEDPDQCMLGIQNAGGGQILPEKYALQGQHPVVIRAVSPTSALIGFASPDGTTDQKILDLETGTFE